MKCKYLFLLPALALVSCGLDMEVDLTQVNDDMSMANAENVLGVKIDPNHTWTAIKEYSITVTADAPLEDVAQVKILTESPFGNDEAEVLNTVDCHKGDVVTMRYETPIDLTQLVAACVSSKGICYIKVFNVGDSSVKFGGSSSANTRASSDDYPTSIKLGSGIPSFNAQRAQASLASDYHNVKIMDNGNDGLSGRARYYDVWNDGSWSNDVLWSHSSVEGGGWGIEDGTIFKPVSDVGDLTTLSTICNNYIKKTGGTNQTNGKANNWQGVAQGNAYFSVNNNYLVSTGGPTTIIPVQINSTEGIYNTVYYYYFNPSAIAGMSSDEQARYIKSLPKFKAINGFNGGTKFYYDKEYLLPFYGDGDPSEVAVSVAIPKGYMIGFLNRKNFANSMESCKSGCTYGDGRLNYEVNHLFGHYYTAIDKGNKQTIAISPNGKDTQVKEGGTTNGMDWTSPRIGMFSANNRTYMCFEDGADCNFCDMIIEIKQGTEIIEETMAPDFIGAAYLMCFEDRPEAADYDMNDVVILAERLNESTISIGVLACGAEDNVILHGVDGAYINDREIHAILGIPEKTFINTVSGKPTQGVQLYNVTTSKSIEEYLRGISIENVTTGKSFKMPEHGKSPYIIIVPHNFKYPKEGISIKNAYPGFLEWASDMNARRDWFRAGEAEMLFKDLFY